MLRTLVLLCWTLAAAWASVEIPSSTSVRMGKAVQAVACPNMCGSGGICIQQDGNSPSAVCSCFPGFYGLDCSLRLCPSGNAWVDFPSANDVAHAAFTECSNQGTCDRNLGSCRCRLGFTGPACELLLCPAGTSLRGYQEQCSGHGRCVTLREAGERMDGRAFTSAASYAGWDQDMLAGCACEAGWEGPACDLRSCPKGDDPETPGLPEVQLLECTCSTCAGGVRLTFEGDTTLDIPFDASDDLIKHRMLQLAAITDIDVRIAFGNIMCSTGGSLTEFVFRAPGGARKPMTVASYGTLAGTIGIKSGHAWSLVLPHVESHTGTTEYVECSGRGTCDYLTGVCRCLPGWQSSDGQGNAGTRGDCGHRYMESLSVTTRASVAFHTEAGVPTAYARHTSDAGVKSLTNCPFVPEVGVCANHGTCDTNTNTCVCDADWQGPVCHKRTCGVSKRWVGEVGDAHANTAECGGIGYCNYETGLCEACGGLYGVFTGSSCQTLSCPKGPNRQACSGTGYCRSMQELAAFSFSEEKKLAGFTYTTSWDARSIHGCACMRAPSVDNKFHSDYLASMTPVERGAGAEAFSSQFYRGPYARAATDFWGFDCHNKKCPHGDNPATRHDHNEQQKIICQATSGTFTLKFRENTTMVINYNDRATKVAYRLEQLFTLQRIDLRYVQTNLQTAATTDSFCSSDSSTVVLVDFLSEFGDLPLLEYTDIDLAGAGKAFAVTEVNKGSKEDVECSRQGVCNEFTGVCACREGFGSSDDTPYRVGDRGDCAWRNRLDVGR